ncbi:MAG: hypothetical protein KatS3mg102_1792 [Planctomycetota bacterium]|nr:MAG: hypothetical protein KatS3mg102_1792 [Planctomycetota bacterium]
MRLFIAARVEPPAAAALADLLATLRRHDPQGAVKWVEAENLHLTLRFLGEVEPPRAAALGPALAPAVAACAPLVLRPQGLGVLPPRGRPRVIHVALEPAAPLGQLAAALERALAPLGFAPERRPLLPHVTLGRVRGGPAARGRGRGPRGHAAGALPPPLRAALQAVAAPVAPPFRLERLVLVRSELRPQGPLYTDLESYPLAGG